MSVFDPETHERDGHREAGESRYQYLSRCPRPEIRSVRHAIEAWYARCSQGEQDLLCRLRGDDRQHGPALWELVCHELLLRCGYAIDRHPKADTGRRAEFHATSAGSELVLEAGLSWGESPDERVSTKARRALEQALSGACCPGHIIRLDVEGELPGDLSYGKIRRSLERHFRVKGPLPYAYPRSPRQAGFAVTVRFLPDPANEKGGLGLSAYGRELTGVGTDVPGDHNALREVLEGKASRYGQLEVPYVVAVDYLGEWLLPGSLSRVAWDALLGVGFPDGKGRVCRLRDGLWSRRQHTRVSAVALALDVTAVSLRDRPMRLFHNPFAAHPLPHGALRIGEEWVELATGRHHTTKGEGLADIFEEYPL